VRRHAERAGAAVDLRLHAPRRLRRAEAAERARREGVGEAGEPVDVDVRAAIAHRRVEDAAVHHHVAQREVGAAVEQEVDLQRGDGAVALEARFVAHPDGVALGGEEDVLVAVVDDLHRLAGLQRRQRAVAGDHRRELLLAAEGAADRLLPHADLLRGQAERFMEFVHHIIRTLQAAAQEHAAVLLRNGDHALRLDVELLLVARRVLAFDNEIGLGQPRGHVALDDGLAAEHVLGRGRAARETTDARGGILLDAGDQFPGLEQRDQVVERQDRREFLDVGLDVFRRLLRQRERRRGDESQRLADVADRIGGQHRHRAIVHDEEIRARKVGRGDDGDLRPVERGVQAEAAQPAVGHGRADDKAMPAAGKIEVIHVLREAPHLLEAIHAGDALADDALAMCDACSHRIDIRVSEYAARPNKSNPRGRAPRVRSCTPSPAMAT